ncbi:hypothetical protein SAMN05216476_2133 [Pseudomonas mediterranea]|uniref:Uncharacterized protein n=1 Tax=Pseudomonas mediterranea TaxID=183795 RepID=A0AAX2DAB3_9PSED|nr:hypothetical protein SAMN05216476_2133 [Pseudomonas mediterranea]
MAVGQSTGCQRVRRHRKQARLPQISVPWPSGVDRCPFGSELEAAIHLHRVQGRVVAVALVRFHSGAEPPDFLVPIAIDASVKSSPLPPRGRRIARQDFRPAVHLDIAGGGIVLRTLFLVLALKPLHLNGKTDDGRLTANMVPAPGSPPSFTTVNVRGYTRGSVLADELHRIQGRVVTVALVGLTLDTKSPDILTRRTIRRRPPLPQDPCSEVSDGTCAQVDAKLPRESANTNVRSAA